MFWFYPSNQKRDVFRIMCDFFVSYPVRREVRCESFFVIFFDFNIFYLKIILMSLNRYFLTLLDLNYYFL